MSCYAVAELGGHLRGGKTRGRIRIPTLFGHCDPRPRVVTRHGFAFVAGKAGHPLEPYLRRKAQVRAKSQRRANMPFVFHISVALHTWASWTGQGPGRISRHSLVYPMTDKLHENVGRGESGKGRCVHYGKRSGVGLYTACSTQHRASKRQSKAVLTGGRYGYFRLCVAWARIRGVV